MSAKTSAPARSTLAIDARTLSEPVFPLDDTQQKQSPESSAPVMTPNSAFGSPRLPDLPPYLGMKPWGGGPLRDSSSRGPSTWIDSPRTHWSI